MCSVKQSKSLFIADLFKLSKSLRSFEASLMCEWWPLPHRIDWHAPGGRVHALKFVACFSSDELTPDSKPAYFLLA
jgi:hypothetical protein